MYLGCHSQSITRVAPELKRIKVVKIFMNFLKIAGKTMQARPNLHYQVDGMLLKTQFTKMIILKGILMAD